MPGRLDLKMGLCPFLWIKESVIQKLITQFDSPVVRYLRHKCSISAAFS